MKVRIKVKSLPFGETTDQGRYYAEVDGEKVGEDGRCFWDKWSDAKTCGVRFFMRKHNSTGIEDAPPPAPPADREGA
jgi:hypothetical protein